MEGNNIFPPYSSVLPQKIKKFLFQDYNVVPSYYGQQKKSKNKNKSYGDSIKTVNAILKTKLSKRSIEIQPDTYHDPEAFEMASEIVRNYFTMRQAGLGESNPIVDRYFSNGEECMKNLVFLYSLKKTIM